MTVRQVLRMGDPGLREVAQAVTGFDTEALHALVQDMFDTMRAHDGVGLAAVQIGVPLRVVVFGFEENPRYPDAPLIPPTVLINPEITRRSQATDEAWEGCLSVPGMRGLVPRYSEVHYRGQDIAGNVIDREVEGFHARVVQHECDHLDGILYPQRIRDLRMFGFIDELQASGLLTAPLPCEDPG